MGDVVSGFTVWSDPYQYLFLPTKANIITSICALTWHLKRFNNPSLQSARWEKLKWAGQMEKFRCEGHACVARVAVS